MRLLSLVTVDAMFSSSEERNPVGLHVVTLKFGLLCVLSSLAISCMY